MATLVAPGAVGVRTTPRPASIRAGNVLAAASTTASVPSQAILAPVTTRWHGSPEKSPHCRHFDFYQERYTAAVDAFFDDAVDKAPRGSAL